MPVGRSASARARRAVRTPTTVPRRCAHDHDREQSGRCPRPGPRPRPRPRRRVHPRPDPDDPVRAAARDVPGRARPVHRGHLDPHDRRRPARALHPGVGDHGVPDHLLDHHADLRQARRPLRPQEALPVRDHGLHPRLGRVLLRHLDVHAGRAARAAGPRRRGACSPWCSRSSATSSPRGSARSTPVTSWPSSPPRACSGRSPAACSPARTRSWGSPAGAGSSW